MFNLAIAEKGTGFWTMFPMKICDDPKIVLEYFQFHSSVPDPNIYIYIENSRKVVLFGNAASGVMHGLPPKQGATGSIILTTFIEMVKIAGPSDANHIPAVTCLRRTNVDPSVAYRSPQECIKLQCR